MAAAYSIPDQPCLEPAEAAPMTATLGHLSWPSSGPRVIELAAVAHRPRASPRAGDAVYLRQLRQLRQCETGFQLAFLVGQDGGGRPPAAWAHDAAANADAGEAGDEVCADSPRPKFVVLPPDFAGQCACELRVLPCCPEDNSGAADESQDFRASWRQVSHGESATRQHRTRMKRFTACSARAVALVCRARLARERVYATTCTPREGLYVCVHAWWVL